MNKKNENFQHLKVKKPCRDQMEFQITSLDETLEKNHKARDVWSFVMSMDNTPIFSEIKSLHCQPGRPATSPEVLLAVWIYSILDGNYSARKLEELCHNHTVYKWLVGGTEINRTMLAEFKSNNPFKFNELLSSCLAVMVQSGLLSDRDFSQDGTRVKANAGFASFRREASLIEMQNEIQDYLENLERGENYEKRKEEELKKKQEKVEAALKALQETRMSKVENGKKCRQVPSDTELKKVRASTTDSDCRKMKMGDGGFRLAYNVQFATGVDSRVIFDVDVVNTLDPGTSPVMMAKVHNRLKKLGLSPADNWLVDSAYSAKDDVTKVDKLFPNCRYIAPPKVKKGCDPSKHQKGDSEAVKKWRDRLENPEDKEIYKKRCSTAEFSNAQVKNKGLTKFSVRGLVKVKGEALLHAIANNIERFFDLSKKKDKEVYV